MIPNKIAPAKKWFMLFGLFVLLLGSIPLSAYAAEKPVHVYFNDELIEFDVAEPVIKNGRTLVPFRKLFETLGFTVEWEPSARKAIGTKEGLAIELTIDSTTAKVNGKSVKLDVPAQIMKESTMVPLRFVSENSGYFVAFSNEGAASEIWVSEEPIPEPFIVQGWVVDSDGNPVEGAEVFADNQLLYNSNLITYTDANGYYRIELPDFATTWNMGGSYDAEIEGDIFHVDLTPVIDQPFAGNTGAIRNFIVQSDSVMGELYVYQWVDDYDKLYLEDNIKITLTPLNGGPTITGYGFNFPGGFGMNDIPVGRYKVTGEYAEPGEEPIPLYVRVRHTKEYAESTTFEFKPLVAGIYQAELEFWLDNLNPGPEPVRPF